MSADRAAGCSHGIVSRATLPRHRYLPEQRVNSGLPALFGVKASAGKAFESEREILYQVLFGA